MIWWLPLSWKNKEAILKRNRQIVEEKSSPMDVWIAKEPKASWIRPASVSTSFVKLDVDRPIEEFALELLQEYGVLVVPGNRFDKESHVRIGYCCDKEVLQRGLGKTVCNFLINVDNATNFKENNKRKIIFIQERFL